MKQWIRILGLIVLILLPQSAFADGLAVAVALGKEGALILAPTLPRNPTQSKESVSFHSIDRANSRPPRAVGDPAGSNGELQMQWRSELIGVKEWVGGISHISNGPGFLFPSAQPANKGLAR